MESSQFDLFYNIGNDQSHSNRYEINED